MTAEGSAEALEDARARLAARDVAGAFDALLTAWRSLRAAEIAKLCESLSARVFSDAVAIKGADDDARLIAWADAFRDHTPLGLEPLLADFNAVVTNPGFSRTAVNLRLVFPRVDALNSVLDDPRIAPPMLRALPILNGGTTWQKVIRRCLLSLEAAGDPRAIQGLEALFRGSAGRSGSGSIYQTADALRERGPENLAKLRARFPEGVPPLPKSLANVVRSIEELICGASPAPVAMQHAKSTTAGDPESLLQAVYDAPDDDELRMVLADALTDRGDPQGELIVVQTRRANGQGTRKTIARERQLIKTHGKAWLGPLAPIVTLKSAVFERGFLEACDADAKTDEMANVHFSHPEWATVRSVTFLKKSRITPSMRALRKAGPLDQDGFQQLAAMGGHPKLEHIDITVKTFMNARVPSTNAGVAFAAATFPSLRHLTLFVRGYGTDSRQRTLEASDFRWLWDTSWGGQLQTLGVPCAVDTSDWIDVLLSRTHLEEIRLGAQSEVVLATLRRPSSSSSKSVELTLHQRAVWSEENAAEPYLIGSFVDWMVTFGESSKVSSLKIEAPKVIFSNSQREEIRRSARRFPGLRETIYPWSR